MLFLPRPRRSDRRFTALALPLIAASLLACGDDGGGRSDAGGGGSTGASPTATTGAEAGSGGDEGPAVVSVASSSGSGVGGGGGEDTSGCGDGAIEPGEVCDDANSEPGDGCSADCRSVEQDFACPTPGEPCVSTVSCGNGVITGQETCDDGDAAGGDGCSATCELEDGWTCPLSDAPCIAAACGDGIVAGNEECEDGGDPPASGDGCSDACARETGWECGAPGEPCHLTVCNDGTREGDEPCDDGNLIIGDGCSPFCEVEPDCSGGACVSACGDGLILPGDDEECDDGNTNSGDGCSDACVEEAGWTCVEVEGELPAELQVPVAFRDFNRAPLGDATRHPDFEIFGGGPETPGLVEAVLGADGKPMYTGLCENPGVTADCPFGQQTTSEASFDQWYRDVAGVNQTRIELLTLTSQGGGTYFFPDATFFPLDGEGWVEDGLEEAFEGHNFGFTSEVRTWFQFEGGESLTFSGDDDVWVFINDRLALDLGGLHPEVEGSFVLDDATAAVLGLALGNVYEIALFHAERHTNASNFNLTLAGFVHAESECETTCGDMIVAGDEICDDGTNDGSYGTCDPDCTPGPRCGDDIVQEDEEACDDGINLGTYGFGGEPLCAPGCVLGAYCGDGAVQSLFGEECDDGDNEGGYGGCEDDCTLGPRCGDDDLDADEGEECDDGNTVTGDGCSEDCREEGPN